jgi:HTH-type transcriptional regulator/antitoxin HigA
VEIKQIINEEDYQVVLKRIDQIFDAPTGSAKAKELEQLTLIVNKYESEHYPIEEPDAKEYAKIRKEEMKPRITVAH